MIKKINNDLLSLLKKYKQDKNSLTEDELFIIEKNKPLLKEHFKELSNLIDKLEVNLINSNEEELLKIIEELKNIDYLNLKDILDNKNKDIKKDVKNIINGLNKYIDSFNFIIDNNKEGTINNNTIKTNQKISFLRDEVKKINTILNSNDYIVDDLVEIIKDKELKENILSKINELKINDKLFEPLKQSLYKSNELLDEDKKILEFFDNEEIYNNLNSILNEKGISEKIKSKEDLSTLSNKYKSIFKKDEILEEIQRINLEREKQSNLKSLELYSKYSDKLSPEIKELYKEIVIGEFNKKLDKEFLNEKKDNLIKEIKNLIIENKIDKKTEQQEYIDQIISSFEETKDIEKLKSSITNSNLNQEIIDKLFSIIQSGGNIVEKIRDYNNKELNIRFSLFNKIKDKSSFLQILQDGLLTSLEKDYLQSLLSKHGIKEEIDKIDENSYSFESFLSKEFENFGKKILISKDEILKLLDKYEKGEISIKDLLKNRILNPIITQLINEGKIKEGNIIENLNNIKISLGKSIFTDFNENDYIGKIEEEKENLNKIGKELPKIKNEIEIISNKRNKILDIIKNIISYDSLSDEEKESLNKELKKTPELVSIEEKDKIIETGNSLLNNLDEKLKNIISIKEGYENQLKEFGFNKELLTIDLLFNEIIFSKYLQKKNELEEKYKIKDLETKLSNLEEERKSLELEKENLSKDTENEENKNKILEIDNKIKEIDLLKKKYLDVNQKILYELEQSDIGKQKKILENGLGGFLSNIIYGKIISDGYIEKIKKDTENTDDINDIYTKEEMNIFRKNLFKKGLDNIVNTIDKIKNNEFVTGVNEGLSTTKNIFTGDFLLNNKVEEYFDKIGTTTKKITISNGIGFVLELSNFYFKIYSYIIGFFDNIYKWVSLNSGFVVQILFIITSIILFLLTLSVGQESFIFKSVYNSNVFLPVNLNIENLLENSNTITKTGIYLTTNFFTGFFTIIMGSLMIFILMIIILRILIISGIDTKDNVEGVDLKNEKIKLSWNIITFIILILLNLFLIK